MSRFQVRKKIRLPLPVYMKGHAFFITITTYHKYPWFHLYQNLCDLVVKEMRDLALPFKVKIYAWCIMPDHIHFLLQCNNTVNFVRTLKGRMTPEARQLDPEKRLWQRSFYDHALRREENLSDVSCYIWENPVRAEIVQNPVDYCWSGSEAWPNWRNFYRQNRKGGGKPRPYTAGRGSFGRG
jgi:REP element-mobilizing transposase RayT